jgi:sulfur relay (sulfurtransferase) complex TusBCD TusD component (DsrE family)
MTAAKSLGILLFSTPYTYESTDIKIAETALKAGHQVSIFAYGGGVHGFTAGQEPLAGLEDRGFQAGSSWQGYCSS